MILSEKIKKIRKHRLAKSLSGEKSGVLNGLMVLGAIAGAALLASEKASATPPECNSPTHDVTDTKINSHNLISDTDGINTASWGNHYWWDHSWYNHGWGSGG